MEVIVLIEAFLLFSSLVATQHGVDGVKLDRMRVYESMRTVRPPQIDGDLSEMMWEKAAVMDGMVQKYPDPGKPASFKTKIRVLHDDEALYVSAYCHDPEPDRIVARVTRRDRWIESDWFQVELDSRRDLRSGYFFAVNAAGVRYDGTLFNENQEDPSWDGVWTAETRLVPDGWTLEMRIPLSLLRFSQNDELAFGVNFTRRISRLNESDQWQFIPPDTGLRVSRFGELRNLDVKRKPGQFEISPYLASRADVEDGRFSTDARSFDVGVDAKVGLGSSFMLTMTANPDFGQVEADQVVLNLSTIETYFPEKRSFFLEDGSLFQMPRFGDGGPRAELFYTRRVGQAPRSVELEDGEDLVREAPLPRIYGAAKLSGTTENRLSVGLVQAITSSEYARVRNVEGKVTDRLAEPATSYSILRLDQGFGDNSAAGLILTAVNTADDGSAVTGGTNLQLEFLDGRYNATLLTQMSYLSEKRYELQDDFTREALERQGPFGFGSELVLNKKSGEHMIGAVGGTYRSSQLALNDVGYLDRPDMLMTWVWMQLRHLKPVGPIGQMFFNANGWLYRNNDLVNIGDGMGFSAQINFINNMFVGSYYNLSSNRCDDRETRTAGRVLVCGLAARHMVGLYANTDPGQIVSIGIDMNRSNTDRGEAYTISAPVTINPTSRLQLELIPRYENTEGRLRWIDTQKDVLNERFLFALQHAEIWDLTLRSTLTFMKDFTLQSYAQVFLASVDYTDKFAGEASGRSRLWLDNLELAEDAADDHDSTTGALNLGMVLRWEYMPGSIAYLVYTGLYDLEHESSEFRFGNTLGDLFSTSARHTLMLKLSYLWS